MRPWRAIAALGFAHAAIDATTGFALASSAAVITPVQLVILVTAYNAIAFVVQPLVGLVVDRLRAPQLAAVFGLAAAACGCLTMYVQPWMGVVLMGIGSALFHVGGGALACAATPDKSTGPGFFTGPGVIGLSLGTACGLVLPDAKLAVLFALVIAIVLLAKTTMTAYVAPPRSLSSVPMVAIAIILLILGSATRSSVWTTTQTFFMGNVSVLLALGIAAGVGKMLGGLAGDKLGARTAAVGSLLLASSLMIAPTSGRFVLAMLLLQSSTPIILAMVVRRMPRFPATATGLVLGLALALGGIPLMFFHPPSLFQPDLFAAMLLTASVLCFAGLTFIRHRRDA